MLDPDQQEATTSDPRRPLLILAHAGTGKTRTLVERLTLLAEARRAGLFGARSGGAIAALTFTRAATRELRDRLAARAGDDALDGYAVRTFHALGFTLYRDGWARDYDNRPHLHVATRAQAQQAATEAARVVGLDLTPHQGARLVADAKLGLSTRDTDPDLVNAVLAVHDDLLAERDLLHIHDLLARPVRLLAEIPALRRELRARYCCVVGDEAQDCAP